MTKTRFSVPTWVGLGAARSWPKATAEDGASGFDGGEHGANLNQSASGSSRQLRGQSCTLMSRSALDPGVVVSGAMLLEDRTSTIYIPAGWSAENDKYGNLILRERR